MNDDMNVEDFSSDDNLGSDYEEQTEPTKTYKVENGRIQTTTDNYDAMVQAIDKILKTERFVYPIYDENYGNDFTDLIGKNADYMQSECERMLKEALMADDRVTGVDLISIKFDVDSLHLYAAVYTIFGNTTIEQEVDTE